MEDLDRRAMLSVAGIAGVAALGVMATRANAGPVDPPAGPVISTGKTLTEVEPRTAVNAANTPGDASAVYVISQPGSYYLTGNITAPTGKAGVRIDASHVTLDLNGFGITGAGSGVQAAFFTNLAGISVRNGTLHNLSGQGVYLAGTRSSRVEDVVCANNSGGVIIGDSCIVRRVCVDQCTGSGINAGANAVVTECAVRGSGSGISATDASTVSGCSVTGCSSGLSVGVGGVVTGCSSVSNAGVGFFGDAGSVFESCAAAFNSGGGFSLFYGGTVRGCTAKQNTGVGIAITEAGMVLDCNATQNSGAGAHGIVVGGGSTVSRCASGLNSGAGVTANTIPAGNPQGSTIENCTLRLNTLSGIQTGPGCVIRDNNVVRNNQAGIGGSSIYVNGPGCRVEGNEVSHSAYNGIGIYINTGSSAGRCFIVRNSVQGHTQSYNIDTNNMYATIFNGTGLVQAAGGNGTVPSQFSTDPWANVAQ